MKNLLCAIVIAFVVSAGFFSCTKASVNGVTTTPKSNLDTSTVMIANQQLVGNWTLVSDSVKTYAVDTLYKGGPNDHYTFTKYGNLYIKVAFNRTIDTAVYAISPDNKVSWTNLFVSQLGGTVTSKTMSGDHTILSVSDHELVLYQSLIFASVGRRAEVIKLKK